MAIINSYPLVTPKLTDLILVTSAGSNGRNKTASFTVGAMQNLMAGVTSVTSGNVNTIVIGGTTQQPTVGSVTAAIVQNGLSLATGGYIYTFVTTNHTATFSQKVYVRDEISVLMEIAITARSGSPFISFAMT